MMYEELLAFHPHLWDSWLEEKEQRRLQYEEEMMQVRLFVCVCVCPFV